MSEARENRALKIVSVGIAGVEPRRIASERERRFESIAHELGGRCVVVTAWPIRKRAAQPLCGDRQHLSVAGIGVNGGELLEALGSIGRNPAGSDDGGQRVVHSSFRSKQARQRDPRKRAGDSLTARPLEHDSRRRFLMRGGSRLDETGERSGIGRIDRECAREVVVRLAVRAGAHHHPSTIAPLHRACRCHGRFHRRRQRFAVAQLPQIAALSAPPCEHRGRRRKFEPHAIVRLDLRVRAVPAQRVRSTYEHREARERLVCRHLRQIRGDAGQPRLALQRRQIDRRIGPRSDQQQIAVADEPHRPVRKHGEKVATIERRSLVAHVVGVCPLAQQAAAATADCARPERTRA